VKIVVDHISGSRRGQRQEFDVTPRVRFGRHPDNEVTFDAHRDLEASARHAELRQDGEQFVLRDVGSSNGMLIDGKKVSEVRIAAGTPTEVMFGAGGPRVRVFIGREEDIPDLPPATSAIPRTRVGRPPWSRPGSPRGTILVALVVVVVLGLALIAGVFIGRLARNAAAPSSHGGSGSGGKWAVRAAAVEPLPPPGGHGFGGPGRCVRAGFARQ
jgi:hypothetical protein